MEQVRVGIVGVGYLGTQHARILSYLEEAELKGVADIDFKKAVEIGNRHGVAYYQNYEDWAADAPVAFVATTGSGSTVTFALTPVPPGTYYLDIWKDNDNDTVIDPGDFFGWYGSGAYPNQIQLTPFAVNQGAMTNLGTIIIFAL